MAAQNQPVSLTLASDPSQPTPMDLKHMTSNHQLTSPTKDQRSAPRRTSQHLRTGDRIGSPTSIPSSPTSIHSSSSAIFERDIEPIMPPSPPSHSHRPSDPHRIPRAKTTEQLEHAVPSVLDSAAAILADESDAPLDQVAVVAPAQSSILDAIGLSHGGPSSGFASPLSLRSRSPSPHGSRKTTDLLLSIPVSPVTSTVSPHIISSSGPARSPATSQTTSPVLRPKPLTAELQAPSMVRANSSGSTAPSLVTPAQDHADESTLPTATREHPPTTALSSHPPSPTHAATKRLSFISYSDLLTSTPASTLSLSSLTTSASTAEPPPHIPSVSGLNLVSAAASVASSNASYAGSIRGVSLNPTGGLTHPGKRDSIALLDNVGGEWEREGLGRGLEERLDAYEASVVSTPIGASNPTPLPPIIPVGTGKA